MPQGEYEIKISADGSEVEIDAQKFEGTGCLDFMGDIMKKLGNTEVKKKPEYHQSGGSGVKVGA